MTSQEKIDKFATSAILLKITRYLDGTFTAKLQQDHITVSLFLCNLLTVCVLPLYIYRLN